MPHVSIHLSPHAPCICLAISLWTQFNTQHLLWLRAGKDNICTRWSPAFSQLLLCLHSPASLPPSHYVPLPGICMGITKPMSIAVCAYRWMSTSGL